MKSKITGGSTTLLFTAKVLNQYDVKYYRCNDTGFIQTENPYWLPEAYSDAITKLDIGLPYRNIQLADRVSKILVKHFDKRKQFLDYAGGYGLFTRLMRDKGFDFYHSDEYCQNLFAAAFDLAELPVGTRLELITAFEVFEHLPDPLPKIREMMHYADSLLFSTELQPENITGINDWWYFAPETGQHIAFYTEKALSYIAQQLGYQFYTDGAFLHLFTKKTFSENPLIPLRDSFLVRKAKKFIKKAEQAEYPMPEGLLMKDHDAIKSKLNKK